MSNETNVIASARVIRCDSACLVRTSEHVRESWLEQLRGTPERFMAFEGVVLLRLQRAFRVYE